MLQESGGAVAIKSYQDMMTWDRNNVSSPGILGELNIGRVADYLEE